MLPLTFIAGVYGMNFDHMPELHWRYGYVLALVVMAAVATGIGLFFRHKGWIGAAAREAVPPRRRRRHANHDKHTKEAA
jgi:hypothetical protein